MRIIDWLRLRTDQDNPVFSFEFFTPKSEDGVAALYERVQRLALANPAWVDVTWAVGNATAERTLNLCGDIVQFLGLDVLLHLTCLGLTRAQAKEILDAAKEKGVRNILANRGDAQGPVPKGSAFPYAADFVRFIRQEYGEYFCIAVAGYPEGHWEAGGKELGLQHLKAKVDAGADFIVTQLFYDVEVYSDFVQRARAVGIEVDIFPGLMPIQSYAMFKRMVEQVGIEVPARVRKDLDLLKSDDAKVKEYGQQLAVSMARELFATGGAPGVHIYTLNQDDVPLRLVEQLDLVDPSRSCRLLPWRPSKLPAVRTVEDVRPIFWKHRENSYVTRTAGWDEFPSGRFGPRVGAYGDFPMHPPFEAPPSAAVKEAWKFSDLRELQAIFGAYYDGSGKVPRLPWVAEPPGEETLQLRRQLAKLCALGALPINAQPRVNGALSSDPVVGWGTEGGYVYQRGYVEFFCSPKDVEVLIGALDARKENSLAYMAVNAAGQVHASSPPGTVTAVTWGVFPSQEVKQPVVVDFESFLAWKDEAFALWDEWADVFPDVDAPQRSLIQEIQSVWFLVSIVDNDYVGGDLFGKLTRFF